MRGRGKEQSTAVHTVWARLVVVVVLTAKLSLPGRTELKQLGGSGGVWWLAVMGKSVNTNSCCITGLLQTASQALLHCNQHALHLQIRQTGLHT